MQRDSFPAIWGLGAESILGADIFVVNYLLRNKVRGQLIIYLPLSLSLLPVLSEVSPN